MGNNENPNQMVLVYVCVSERESERAREFFTFKYTILKSTAQSKRDLTYLSIMYLAYKCI